LIELAVKFDDAHTPEKLEKLINAVNGVTISEINLTNETVIVLSSIPVSRVLSTISEAGFPVLFRGASSTASSMKDCDFGSGVAPLTSGEVVYGLCRIFQPTDEYLLVDASLDGLNANQTVTLALHKSGDLSSSAASCGDVYTTNWFNGEIRKVVTDAQGRATVVAEVPGLKLRDLIGRSVVLHDTSTNSR
ncbi:Copper chaperone for superoxide dismutase, partial [Fasciolopsis buskii]